MGLKKFLITCLALLIFAVMRSEADCSSDISQCDLHLAGLNSLIKGGQLPTADQIKPYCPDIATFQTCLNNVPDNCKNDPAYSNSQRTAAGFSTDCSGSKCSIYKLFQCMKNVNKTVNLGTLTGINGFPTKEQLQPLCSNAKPVMTCLTNFFKNSKCASNVDAETKSIKQMEMTKKMLTLLCQDVYPALMENDFECVRNKAMLAEVDKCSSTNMTQVRYESQAEMCSRLEKEKMCIKDASVKYCDEKVASDFSNLFVKFMTTMNNQNYKCNGATSGFQINLWISMLMAAVLLAFLM